MTLPGQPLAIREFCPVCRGRGLVRATSPQSGAKACISCPHCTDPHQLLDLVEARREEAV